MASVTLWVPLAVRGGAKLSQGLFRMQRAISRRRYQAGRSALSARHDPVLEPRPDRRGGIIDEAPGGSVAARAPGPTEGLENPCCLRCFASMSRTCLMAGSTSEFGKQSC